MADDWARHQSVRYNTTLLYLVCLVFAFDVFKLCLCCLKTRHTFYRPETFFKIRILGTQNNKCTVCPNSTGTYIFALFIQAHGNMAPLTPASSSAEVWASGVDQIVKLTKVIKLYVAFH
jgi:hypothetical protein